MAQSCSTPLQVILISDSTGETASLAAQAAISRFRNHRIGQKVFPFIVRPRDLESIPADVWAEGDLVIATLVQHDTRRVLEEICKRHEIPCISLLDPLVAELTRLIGDMPSSRPGQQYVVTPSYLARIAAIDYAIAYDDGQSYGHLRTADVILVGVSRTSKTPTCIYLAYQGIKAANVPLLADRQVPEALLDAMTSGIPVVGLTANAARLVQVRQHRLNALGRGQLANYADRNAVEEELVAARLFFDRHQLPIIDVTRRSIEETAASVRAILQKGPTP